MIPNILNQIFISNTNLLVPPRIWHNYTQTTRKLHTTWEYKFWDNARLKELVDSHYPHLKNYFVESIPAIIQSDIGRYLILKHEGGWYLDFDYEVFRPFNVWNQNNIVLPLEQSMEDNSPKPNRIGNAILASVPGHWFWSLILDNLPHAEFFTSNITHEAILTTTGPTRVTEIYDALTDSQKQEITTPRRVHFHYPTPHMMTSKEYKDIKMNSKIYGLHHTHSAWRDSNLHKNIQRRKYASNIFIRPLLDWWGRYKARKQAP